MQRCLPGSIIGLRLGKEVQRRLYPHDSAMRKSRSLQIWQRVPQRHPEARPWRKTAAPLTSQFIGIRRRMEAPPSAFVLGQLPYPGVHESRPAHKPTSDTITTLKCCPLSERSRCSSKERRGHRRRRTGCSISPCFSSTTVSG